MHPLPFFVTVFVTVDAGLKVTIVLVIVDGGSVSVVVCGGSVSVFGSNVSVVVLVQSCASARSGKRMAKRIVWKSIFACVCSSDSRVANECYWTEWSARWLWKCGKILMFWMLKSK